MEPNNSNLKGSGGLMMKDKEKKKDKKYYKKLNMQKWVLRGLKKKQM